MFRVLFPLLFLLLLPSFAAAAVELALEGRPPVTIDEVYLHEGTAYLAADDVLPVLGLSGKWDAVDHLYRIQTPRGTAVISPGSRYLRLGDQSVPLGHHPRFIDGRLRVPEVFVAERLPALLGLPVRYRNLDPPQAVPDPDETPLDRLFAFLLRRERPAAGPALRGVVLDPGHGGQDPGALGPGGLKEKEVTLEVARRLEKQLKMQLGVPVHLARDGDYALSWQQRLEAAARPDADALLVLHAQASLSPAPRGATLFVRPREEAAPGSPAGGSGDSLTLARHLGSALAAAGIEVAGIFQAPLLPLGRGNLPTVLVELGYLSHPGDLALLRDPAGQDRLARALFEGLKSFAETQKEASP